jgi:rhamnosyltransferase
MDVSIVIRTLNEARHLGALLESIGNQTYPDGQVEVVVVDSGSTDGTLEIAQSFKSRLVHIAKEDFSFGRSLNVGCAEATGDALLFISGHCIPVGTDWVAELIRPLGRSDIVYTYGRQVGNGTSRFSETQIFAKYFPETSRIPQDGFFTNNANSALLKRIWENHRFDEQLTGLEDMHLAKRLIQEGYRCAYVAEAPVYHLHNESWRQVRRRFEREAIALQHIMPEIHVGFADFLRYVSSAIMFDFAAALQQKRFTRSAREIVCYRLMQFWGSYRGNHIHRDVSRRRKESYFFPR